ncbi:hypothetical protein ACIQV3_34840 [Streptomyces sp. NPDC099050]|uniref:hypothetical protein n=1 Tax=Streptomyces sp. NPDC099050 TaxID=3366100 RepID=UPI0037FADDD7
MDRQQLVVALLDATGALFEPALTAFPGSDAAAWERAALPATAHLTRAFVEPPGP